MLHLNIRSEIVKSVYSGKGQGCMCGCRGRYFYASQHVEAASKYRGYEVTPDEVSDKMIAKVVRILNESEDTQFDVSNGHVTCAYTTVESGRYYVAFFIN